jgi:hypothetical protein
MTNQANSDDFPTTAVVVEEALRNFVPSELWQAYEQAAKARRELPRRSVRYSEYVHGPQAISTNRPAAQIKTAEAAMRLAWQRILGEFGSQLQAGKLRAYVREAFPFGPVVPIPSDAWKSLRITNISSGRAKGGGVELIGIRIAPGAPSFSRPIEDRPEAQLSSVQDEGQAHETMFTANEDYTFVRIGTAEFHFGDLQAAIIRELHLASRTAEPWCRGKELLDAARSNSNNVGDLFRRHLNPSWRVLIEYRHNGKYRLAVAPPQ